MSSISDIRHQLWVLGLIRATEAIAWTSIFPYVYFMVQSFKVSEDDIAFYSGSLIAVFTFGEFLTGLFWARVSDKIGRKPTLLLGIFCGLVTALALGLSRSVAVAVASRAFGGLFNPNVSLVPTCTGELATKDQRAKAFSLVTFIRSLGNLIGPVLGGLLADPSALYPSVFPQNSLWTNYPYLLPNLAVGLLQLLTFILTFLVLRETHPQMPKHPGTGLSQILNQLFIRRGPANNATYAPLEEDSAGLEAQEDATEEHSLEDLQKEPRDGARSSSDSGSSAAKGPAKEFSGRAFTFQAILQILAVSLLAFHKVAFETLMGTFLALEPAASDKPANGPTPRGVSFPHSRGGFGFDTRVIGIIFLTEAIFRAAIQPTVIPWFIQKLGVLRAFRWVLGLYPAMYIFTPFLPKIPEPFQFVFLLPDLWIRVAFSSMGYICSAVLITNTSPSRQALARINGAAASLGCLARSVGPLLSGKLFAASLQSGYLQIPFWTLGAVALVGAVESTFLLDHH
ncbi:hypothetical protein VTK56DRAFT_6022 [Thermocarpiscus australiensis]